MPSTIRFSRNELLLLVFIAAVFLPALSVLPYQFPVPQDVHSVAAYLGYNGKVAHMAAVALCGLCVLAFCWTARTVEQPGNPSQDRETRLVSIGARFLEIAVVFAGVFLLYCPIFLARYGPYIEDNYYLSLLHRMEGGQLPYRDFEYLYGPLLLYPQHWWLQVFGYSMKSYYTFQALMEGLAYSVLLWTLQGFYPAFKRRAIAFAILSILLFNTVLAQNYNGLRRLIPVVALLWIAQAPKSWKALAGASVMFGFWLAYSHELAIAGLVAAGFLYVILWFRERDTGMLLRGLGMCAIAITVWYVVVSAILGDALGSYFQATLFVLDRFTAGEQAFPFRWTLNSLALFGLLLLGCAITGKGLRARGTPAAGDLLLFASVAYACVALRAGFNRSDIWHLIPPVLPLVFAFLLPLPRNLVRFSGSVQRFAVCTVAILSLTYLLSLAPFGSFYVRGLLRGFQDVAGGKKENVSFVSRTSSIEPERSHPDPDVRKLGEYLAGPDLRERDVVFYSRLWALDKRVGVLSPTYLPDDFFMTDQAGYAIARLIEERKPVVVMQEIVYRHLFGEIGDEEYEKYLDRQPMTATKQLLAWVSTPFFRDLPLEWKLKEERWERTVAPALAGYHKVTSFGSLFVLMPR